MTPEAISAINAVCSLLERIGTWPIGLIILIAVLGPWILAGWVSLAQEKRFAAMREMYKNNVKLVDSYAKIADGLLDSVTLNTTKWTEAINKIDTNQYCPQHRTRKVRMEDVQT
jgi:hypothetical protein